MTGPRSRDAALTGARPTSDEARVRVPGPVDRDAEFSAFVTEAGPALVRTAWMLCGDPSRAEDLAQQALLRTYLAWPKVRDGNPLGYARRVVATARIDSWRKHRREVLVAPGDVAGSNHSPENAHAERDLLVRALLTLSARQRRIVVLRYLVGMSEAEVAADLGVSLGTVKSTASRGLARLRGELGDDGHPRGGSDE